MVLLLGFIGIPAAAHIGGSAKIGGRSSTATNPVYTPANVSTATSAVIKVTVSDGAASVNQSLTLTVNDTPVRSETVTYYHNDALGSPVAATDQSGTLLWRETYRPYGERLNNQAASSNNPIWYTGKRQDAETGLVYMGSRYYDPRLGRFLSIDPVEPDENNLHSLNRYAYANNNPYKFTDPDGQIAETIIDVVSLGLSINTFRQDPSFLNGLAVAYDGFATAVPFLPAGIGIIRQAATKGETLTQVVKQAADRGAAKAGEGAAEKVATEGGALTSRAARREAMRDAGIPTSQQPVSQSRNKSGREYSYDVSAPGGGTQRMSVQQQTMDKSHPGQPHWEAGRVKIDKETGSVRMNNHGRPTLTNDKSKVNY